MPSPSVHADYAAQAHSVVSRSLRQFDMVSQTHKRAAAATKSVPQNDGRYPCSAAAACSATAGAASSPPAWAPKKHALEPGRHGAATGNFFQLRLTPEEFQAHEPLVEEAIHCMPFCIDYKLENSSSSSTTNPQGTSKNVFSCSATILDLNSE